VRIGASPTKFGATPERPERVTVAVVTYIPFQEGYFEQRLAILKLCLASLLAATSRPFDLLVYDNGSCPEALDYLVDLRRRGHIQYLILSDRNVGQVGAWNFVFGAAPSEYVAYADSDVLFYPGWLDEELKVMEAFPNVGMVSGLPAMHTFGLFTGSTLRWAETDPETTIERGQFMPDEWILDWGQSTGHDPVKFLADCRQIEQVRLTRRGVTAYAVAAHFQFLARTATAREVLPLPNTRLAGITRLLDERLDSAGYLRLSVQRPAVRHLGNVLTEGWAGEARRLGIEVDSARLPRQHSLGSRLAQSRVIRRAIIEIYQAASRLRLYAR
jgi:glycosyltransferase involved in cell wall biosynthesis